MSKAQEDSLLSGKNISSGENNLKIMSEFRTSTGTGIGANQSKDMGGQTDDSIMIQSVEILNPSSMVKKALGPFEFGAN